MGCQLGRLGPLTGRQDFKWVRTVVSLVGGDPGVPMSHNVEPMQAISC
jgi:hypothetical protein